jgi:5'-nucleotidase (lipoprotein e(P4) family)
MLVLALLLVSSACASSTATPARPQPAPAAPSAPSEPAASAKAAADKRAEPESIRWIRDAAEFHAAAYQVYRQATTRVETESAKRTRGTWAVVLDADETVISNLEYQAERARQGLAFTAESWKAWTERREATPIPGAAAFLGRVRALGGRIAIVSNRLDTECDDTAAVFAKHALVYDAMLCRTTTSDKNPRFADVAAGRSPASATPVDVIAYVGDNILDFPLLSQSTKAQGAAGFADFGVRYFLVPNPMYGSWQ